MVSLTTVSAGAVLLAAVFLTTFVDEGEAISCIIGRPGCLVSCRSQNCGTGYCKDRGGLFGTCVCSRCDNGAGPLPWQRTVVPPSRHPQTIPFFPYPYPHPNFPDFPHTYPFPNLPHEPISYARSNDPDSSPDSLPVPHPILLTGEQDESFFPHNDLVGSGEEVLDEVPDLDEASNDVADLDDVLDVDEVPDKVPYSDEELLQVDLDNLSQEDLQRLGEQLEHFTELVKSVLEDETKMRALGRSGSWNLGLNQSPHGDVSVHGSLNHDSGVSVHGSVNQHGDKSGSVSYNNGGFSASVNHGNHGDKSGSVSYNNGGFSASVNHGNHGQGTSFNLGYSHEF